LASLPGNSAETFEQLQREHDELVRLSQILSPLTRLHGTRESLKDAASRLNRAMDKERLWSEKVQALTTQHAEANGDSAAAATARRTAEREATEIRTLRDQATIRLRHFHEIAGESMCSVCGQALSEVHIEHERARLNDHLAGLEVQLTCAANELTASEQHERQVLEVLTKVEEQLVAARERLIDAQQKVLTSRRDQQLYSNTCRTIYAVELDEFARNRVAANSTFDWLSTTYPTQADLDEVHEKLVRFETVRESLRLAKSTLETYQKLHDRVEFVGESIAAQHADLSHDPSALRFETDQLVHEEADVKLRLAENRQRMDQDNTSVDALTAQRSSTQRQLSAKEAGLKGMWDQRNEARATLAEHCAMLSEDWQATAENLTREELKHLQTELNQLLEQGLEARYGELVQAQANVDVLQQTIVELERRHSELPAEACKPVADVERLLASAKARQIACDKELQEAQIRLDRLVQWQNQRRILRDEYLSVSKEHSLFDILAELLGPRKLQRELVRRAEREIVDLANGMLDRVSGGQLELILARSEEDDWLDKSVLRLEARNRSTATAPLGVAFLSGSQRFRVAVSLALGMGQFASARRRSIQSVIIDEGFGSLDREGRQVMIQELQNLRGHLERIVLVSHQEEFADAFPDGYRFELIDGATQITRFHR
jgi:DNA repair exonuclease SbcCD ATPase subunit